MWICSCGFANRAGDNYCIACGSPAPADAGASAGAPTDAPTNTSVPANAAESPYAQEQETSTPMLVLQDVRSGTRIEIQEPGGILGRAGDFEPDLFSPQVSGVHLALRPHDDGHWIAEFLGRNSTSIGVGGVWTNMRPGQDYPLFGGEVLKMADMVFRVSVETPAPSCPDDNCQSQTEPTVESAVEPEPEDEAPRTWQVICPVCGTAHQVASQDDRISRCSFCSDPMDRRKIARVAPVLK